jgi:hypothetical protein
VQWHHIFPKASLRAHYERREINEIANLAFLSGETNRRISDTSAARYLSSVLEQRGPQALAVQCVPVKRALWEVSAYPRFLEARRTLLAEAINGFLDEVGL